MTKTSQKPLALETTLNDLEKIVEKLETKDLSLEESLQLFENGIALTKSCHKTLSEAEQKVQQLLKKNNQFELTDYEQEN